jgi:hypothetical protein
MGQGVRSYHEQRGLKKVQFWWEGTVQLGKESVNARCREEKVNAFHFAISAPNFGSGEKPNLPITSLERFTSVHISAAEFSTNIHSSIPQIWRICRKSVLVMIRSITFSLYGFLIIISQSDPDQTRELNAAMRARR